jgi:hypothetical protein
MPNDRLADRSRDMPQPTPPRRRQTAGSLLVKLAIAAVVLAVFGWLFMRSLQTTRAEPYVADRAPLTGWTVTVEKGVEPAAPVLVLRGPQELVSALFRQVFTRMMESLNAPAGASIPLVLRAEFDRLAGEVPIEALVDLARDAGLERAALEPRCMAHRRISQPGATRQVYFAVFDMPAFLEFREALAARAAQAGATGFDAGALAPVMFVAGSDPAFHRWLPTGADVEADCVAPIQVR